MVPGRLRRSLPRQMSNAIIEGSGRTKTNDEGEPRKRELGEYSAELRFSFQHRRTKLSRPSLRAVVLGACSLLVFAGSAESQEQEALFTGSTLDREALVRAVLERNPTIEAARQAWQAALEREPQVTSLSDPVLSYSVAPLSIGASDVRYGQVFQFAQPLPYPGKLRLRGEVARAEAEAARLDYEGVRLQLATLASLLFDDYYFVHRALEINDEHLELLRDFQRIATVQYSAGIAAQQDPIQAEVELARLLHREIVLDTSRETVSAQVNALLHRRPEAGLPPPPGSLELPGPERLDPLALQEQAVAARPELRGRDAVIEARETNLQLQRLAFYPDFVATSSFNSMWGESDYRWTIGVGINLPIRRDRLRAAVAEAQARLRSAESERLALEDAIRAEVQTTYDRLLESEHVVELFRSRLLPASDDQVRAALAGFETARNSFLALIEAEKNQRTVALGYQEAVTDYYRRRAELERALGRLPGLGGTLVAESKTDVDGGSP